MLRGVIFDFDGVLVDSERAHFEAFRGVLAAAAGLDIVFEEYVEHYLAHDDHAGVRRALEHHGQRADRARVGDLAVRKGEAFMGLLPTIPFLPGARDLVVSLAGADVPLAIASGARRHEIDALLRSQDLLDCFRGIISADDVDNHKPHPEPYLRGRALVGASEEPRGVVAVEDSPTGMASARAANLRVIGVSNSYTRERLGLAHLVVGALTELTVADVAEVVEGATE